MTKVRAMIRGLLQHWRNSPHARLGILNETRGLTLLELLIVVFILGAIALSTISFTNNADSQLRYEQTQTRLKIIRQAVIGDPDPSFQSQRLLSGFVSDLGTLPENIRELTTSATLPTWGVTNPVFYWLPDATGLNSGTAAQVTQLTDDSWSLLKGYRPGYLSPTPGTTHFRDDWGNDDDENFGWFVTSLGTQTMTIASAGSDLTTGETGDFFTADTLTTIEQNDWLIDLGGWQVDVQNATGGPFTPQNTLRASLLVFVPPNSWRRLDTATAITSMTTGQVQTLTFASSAPRIPMGEHLLTVSDMGADGIPGGAADDRPYDSDTVTVGIQPVTQKIAFFPRASRPTKVLQLTCNALGPPNC